MIGATWHNEVKLTLQSVAWAVRSTVNVSIQRFQGQLVFGRDMIMPMRINTYCNHFAATRHRIAEADNMRENTTRIPNEYV